MGAKRSVRQTAVNGGQQGIQGRLTLGSDAIRFIAQTGNILGYTENGTQVVKSGDKSDQMRGI